MRYLREFKDSEINRWKNIDDFGKTKGKSVEELEDEIEIVGGFPDGFIDGDEDGKPMNKEEITKLYKAMADDVEHNKGVDKRNDEEIDDSLEESRILCFESFNDELYWLESIDEKKKSGVAKSLKKKSEASGIPVGILRKVFSKGMQAWNAGHRPGVAQHQWAFGRVNSFITGSGGARKADAELWTKAKAAKERKKKKK
jgi:hypothetical protein